MGAAMMLHRSSSLIWCAKVRTGAAMEVAVAMIGLDLLQARWLWWL